jgi:hypothetical protein
VTVTSLLIRLPSVNRAAGVEPVVPPMTGLISKVVRPKSLLVARCAGALMSASVNKLSPRRLPIARGSTSSCRRTKVVRS